MDSADEADDDVMAKGIRLEDFRVLLDEWKSVGVSAAEPPEFLKDLEDLANSVKDKDNIAEENKKAVDKLAQTCCGEDDEEVLEVQSELILLEEHAEAACAGSTLDPQEKIIEVVKAATELGADALPADLLELKEVKEERHADPCIIATTALDVVVSFSKEISEALVRKDLKRERELTKLCIAAVELSGHVLDAEVSRITVLP